MFCSRSVTSFNGMLEKICILFGIRNKDGIGVKTRTRKKGPPLWEALFSNTSDQLTFSVRLAVLLALLAFVAVTVRV